MRVGVLARSAARRDAAVCRWAPRISPTYDFRQGISMSVPDHEGEQRDPQTQDTRTLKEVKVELAKSIETRDLVELDFEHRGKWTKDFLTDRSAKIQYTKKSGDYILNWDHEDYTVQITFNEELELDSFGEQEQLGQDYNEEEEEEDGSPFDSLRKEEKTPEEPDGGEATAHPHHMEILLTPTSGAQVKMSAYGNKWSRLIVESIHFEEDGVFPEADMESPGLWTHQLQPESESGLYEMLDRLGIDDDLALFVQQTVDLAQGDTLGKELRKFKKWLEIA